MRELIHFAHGNGFPSPCYRQLLTHLESRYDYCYIEKLGHNPKFPVTDNWTFLVDEIINSVKRQAKEPVIGIGHSFGGALTLIAAIEEPSLFKAVVMLDSPLLGRFKSSMLRLAKALGVIDKVTPAARTKGRREHWQNREQLVHYLRSRDLFKHFTDECLDDYIDYGLQKTADGYALSFERHIEYLIYRTIPHSIHQYEGRLTIPTSLLYGDKSAVIDRFDVRYMKKHYGIACRKVKGSHMFPMEDPEKTVNEVFAMLDAIL